MQLHLAAYSSAKRDLSRALEIAPEDEKPKLSALLKQALNGIKKEAVATERQKAALKKAFDDTKVMTDRVEPKKKLNSARGLSSSSINSNIPNSPGSVVLYNLQYMLRLILGFIVGAFMFVYNKIRRYPPRDDEESKKHKE